VVVGATVTVLAAATGLHTAIIAVDFNGPTDDITVKVVLATAAGSIGYHGWVDCV
jgi:hypothetical protein